jgi:2-polyprenyl-3-methyl-5-hydroxy-6-metoxy-1,4-benzoquinol methylase
MARYIINFNLEKLGVKPGDTIVDIGCGEGPFDKPLVEAGFNVIGVEPEAYLRKKFMAWASKLGPGIGTIKDGTGEHLPFKDGEVQTAVITEVLEHVDDPDVCLAELGRVMKPGGTICVSVPTARTEHVYWKLHPGYEKNSTHLRIWGKRELLSAIERPGFKIRHVEGRNFGPALNWLGHATLRSKSDHAGKLEQNLWIEKSSEKTWNFLNKIYVGRVLSRIGNKVWPKSWYVYAEKQ